MAQATSYQDERLIVTVVSIKHKKCVRADVLG